MIDPQIQTIMSKTAEYIEMTQPLIDSFNEQKAEFVKKASVAARTLVEAGLLNERSVDNFIEKVAAKPESVWDVVEKLASIASMDTLGSVANDKVASDTCTSDPWERRFFGDERNSSKTVGLID